MADGGPDRVVQPQDTVTLNGIKSKDDVQIATYQWTMVTQYPFAVLEVSPQSQFGLVRLVRDPDPGTGLLMPTASLVLLRPLLENQL